MNYTRKRGDHVLVVESWDYDCVTTNLLAIEGELLIEQFRTCGDRRWGSFMSCNLSAAIAGLAAVEAFTAKYFDAGRSIEDPPSEFRTITEQGVQEFRKGRMRTYVFSAPRFPWGYTVKAWGCVSDFIPEWPALLCQPRDLTDAIIGLDEASEWMDAMSNNSEFE
ncbi:hypothetical protein EP7_004261 [Isosphaeraceae bacterium EP7]